ncbi:MAG: D-alanyl-D-alanine carboxypeptidase family protein [Acidimicrobiales bacterium]|nr:D-alanyl-D-alanine carboxypeptidase family protein [Acidimicrobiales bacterium]
MIPAVVVAAAKKRAVAEVKQRAPRLIAVGLTALLTVVGLPMMAIIVALAGTPPSAAGTYNGDIPAPALAAYISAADRCNGLDWPVLAAIGRVESDHGRIFGGQIDAHGNVSPFIVGIALDGTNATSAIRTPAGGSPWHDDPHWDHATGPMQFITASWAHWGLDANGDGVASPHNIDDAAAAAADLLCGTDQVLEDVAVALRRYNNSAEYVSAVLGWAATYATATGPPGSEAGNVPLATVQGITVHASLAPNLARLLAAARADGLVLAGWGWRSTQTQIDLRTRNGCPDVYSAPPSTCRVPTAIPGRSMHEQGLAVDFTNNAASITSRSDPAYGWLVRHGPAYGLFNLPSEPWHWSVNAR